jgi:hypothetical protein
MGRTACTEPQYLYSRAKPLLPLQPVRPVQNLSACTSVTFTFFMYTIPLLRYVQPLLLSKRTPVRRICPAFRSIR